ncbi:hypothetical protein [Streptomyces sp. NPDC053079]|uniref:hypothetical protein n=1 Tax=Streptomyces sp. NPDC053079 TaxID=3365697 RepID=UPI0037CE653D
MLTGGVVATAAPAQAADSDAWTFTNTDGTLNATGNNDGNQISVTPDGTNYRNWRLIKLGAPRHVQHRQHLVREVHLRQPARRSAVLWQGRRAVELPPHRRQAQHVRHRPPRRPQRH